MKNLEAKAVVYIAVQYAILLKEKLGIFHLPIKMLSIHIVFSYNVNAILFISVSKIGVTFVINAQIPLKKPEILQYINQRSYISLLTFLIHFKASVPMSDNFNQNIK